ncbi:uncharacterized protein DUF397 [Haloactinospora alba]|uniref:Uncharacterized protein DUF397 n=1 Tax=Haloactinospora alba TaxID=405555 RepID=A0A543NMY1_9ACTN|nr:DUF397 domain-containing protein [Haloactinospora alba]TQN33190.1 uncharacterized protein DUF397 [Haloactinospora alba]
MYSSDELYFRKSSYSATAKECVEIADLPSGVAIRDSKQPESGHLAFPATEWSAFLRELRVTTAL